jgi:hypothetical protein
MKRTHGGPRASINDVLNAFMLATNQRKESMHSLFDNDPLFWYHPSLTIDQIEYAADDVRQLVQLREKMLQLIHDNGCLKWSRYKYIVCVSVFVCLFFFSNNVLIFEFIYLYFLKKSAYSFWFNDSNHNRKESGNILFNIDCKLEFEFQIKAAPVNK